ncbi:MAG: 1,6-anhydro-N-acetylmuramyl-L-alanine amidase AmpD [Gammaproteobacteria bacterium]|nr:1,6-anhydro-N-acetylmuramyl-L-alanine amidase AmpD [Gammaproteobacteria bacterium]
MYTVTDDHWLRGARRMASPNASARPDPEDVCLVVIHGISLPPGKFGTGLVEALFTNTLDTTVDPSLGDLAGVRVSSHLLISRRGEVSQFVAFDHCAWHAGVSSHRGRERCNDYSIGIELEGTDDRPYTKPQYNKLVDVLTVLLRHYPRLSLADVVGHSEIAPGRKTDPGPAFDWPRLYRALGR